MTCVPRLFQSTVTWGYPTMRLQHLFLAASAATLIGLAGAAPARAAGTVILEGSDAVGFHCSGGSSTACDYMNQTWSALGGSDSRTIAVVGSTTFGPIGS